MEKLTAILLLTFTLVATGEENMFPLLPNPPTDVEIGKNDAEEGGDPRQKAPAELSSETIPERFDDEAMDWEPDQSFAKIKETGIEVVPLLSLPVLSAELQSLAVLEIPDLVLEVRPDMLDGITFSGLDILTFDLSERPAKAIVSNPEVKGMSPEPKKMRVRLTFYSGQDDLWGSRVAWSQVKEAKRGRTVAADPTIFPYGTWIEVPGFGKLRVEDTGTAVKSRKASGGREPVIDVYVGDDKEAWRLASGRPHYVEITFSK
jgi:3D (Asp-Asp-Asp) domain-containing protein